MNSQSCRCSAQAADFVAATLPRLLEEAASWGIADCTDGVDTRDIAGFRSWISAGMNASMDYLDRYHSERATPSLLLDGARSIISCAFSYAPPLPGDIIAAYALGSDYHEVVRDRLKAVAAAIEHHLGGQTRVCVDTAPLRERYWALRAGVGFRGLNGNVIVPGKGSYMFLGEIITTVALPPTAPLENDCGRCGQCVRSCPTGALQADGTMDARRCLNYLTIEHRGEFPEGTDLHGRLYGCDTCSHVCPHNAHPAPCRIRELMPRPAVRALTPEKAASLTQDEYSSLFTHSAIKRTKLAGLRRNALTLLLSSNQESAN